MYRITQRHCSSLQINQNDTQEPRSLGQVTPGEVMSVGPQHRRPTFSTLPPAHPSSPLQCQRDPFFPLVLIKLFVWEDQASLVAQMVKNPPEMWETLVRSPGWEYRLEKGMAIHSSILAWRIPMDRGVWWATVHGVAESDTTEQLSAAHSMEGPGPALIPRLWSLQGRKNT